MVNEGVHRLWGVTGLLKVFHDKLGLNTLSIYSIIEWFTSV